MNNPTALFELAARGLNISAGQLDKLFSSLWLCSNITQSSYGADVKIPRRLKQRKSLPDCSFHLANVRKPKAKV